MTQELLQRRVVSEQGKHRSHETQYYSKLDFEMDGCGLISLLKVIEMRKGLQNEDCLSVKPQQTGSS